MADLRFAIVGAGFWAPYQLAGWREIEGAECVAICDVMEAKAKSIAAAHGIPNVYRDVEELLEKEKLDFVDVVTDVDTHAKVVEMAATRKLPVICQKPMAPRLDVAQKMVKVCHDAGKPFLVNENWRWQTPLRELKRILDRGEIGTPFRARLDMISGFAVFRNQPFLRDLEQFILSDLGSHILDVARFLFGEADSLYCQTKRVHADIRGEDVATIVMNMGGKTTVLVEMAYAENPLERECFPQTLVFVEGDKGSVELVPDYWVRTTTSSGTSTKRLAPPHFSWANPAYDIVHSSIVACQSNLLDGLKGGVAETTGADNLKTARLVFAAYDSAKSGEAVKF